MDLKLCSHLPTVNFVDTWTFITIFTSRSRHSGPNIWVLANGSKKIWLGINLWNTYWVLGLLPRYNLIFNHLDFWDPDPGFLTCSEFPCSWELHFFYPNFRQLFEVEEFSTIKNENLANTNAEQMAKMIIISTSVKVDQISPKTMPLGLNFYDFHE